jgi:hypothetical protein
MPVIVIAKRTRLYLSTFLGKCSVLEFELCKDRRVPRLHGARLPKRSHRNKAIAIGTLIKLTLFVTLREGYSTLTNFPSISENSNAISRIN